MHSPQASSRLHPAPTPEPQTPREERLSDLVPLQQPRHCPRHSGTCAHLQLTDDHRHPPTSEAIPTHRPVFILITVSDSMPTRSESPAWQNTKALISSFS